MPEATSQNGADAIPSELVNLQEIHARRIQRRKEALEERNKESGKVLEPLVAEYNKAVRAYEDHFDEGLLKYGHDPNKMPMDEREPQEVKLARKLKRAIEDAEAKVRKKEAEVLATVRGTAEFTAFQDAQRQFEDWLSKVCVFLKCCAADLDWPKRQITRHGIKASIPAELLVVPQA